MGKLGIKMPFDTAIIENFPKFQASQIPKFNYQFATLDLYGNEIPLAWRCALGSKTFDNLPKRKLLPGVVFHLTVIPREQFEKLLRFLKEFPESYAGKQASLPDYTLVQSTRPDILTAGMQFIICGGKTFFSKPSGSSGQQRMMYLTLGTFA